MLKKYLHRSIQLLASAMHPTNKPEDPEPGFSGNYTSWQQASEYATGYDASGILDKVKTATLKVKNGEAVYERDSFVFDQLQHNWPLVAIMEKIAIEKALRLSVLDFGGSLGSGFNYLKKVLPAEVSLNWSIVEQPHFVECGKECFENEELKFFNTIEEVISKRGMPDIVLLSSVLQYIPNHVEITEQLNNLKIENILVDRTAYLAEGNGFWTVQQVPVDIYEASYPAYFFSEKELSEKLFNYNKIYNFSDPFTPPQTVNDIGVFWGGCLYKIKNGK